MKMTTVNKVASLNDKKYYLSDRITSLPFDHLLLLELRDKKTAFSKIQEVIEKEKNNLLNQENKAVFQNERLRILRSIYSQSLANYKSNNKIKLNEFISTRKYILNIDFHVSPVVEMIQKNVEIIIKINEFPKSEDKKEIKKRKKRAERKKLLKNLEVSDLHKAQINSNINK